MPDDELAELIAQTAIEVAAKEAEAQEGLEILLVKMLPAFLQKAQAAKADREYWAIARALVPLAQYFRAVEAGNEDLAEQYLKMLDKKLVLAALKCIRGEPYYPQQGGG